MRVKTALILTALQLALFCLPGQSYGASAPNSKFLSVINTYANHSA
jgi:hypothetical protein